MITQLLSTSRKARAAHYVNYVIVVVRAGSQGEHETRFLDEQRYYLTCA